MADFEDPDQYAAAVESAHARQATILLATPRIQKPGELESFAALLHRGADGILVRNLAAAALCAAQGVPFVADFSLHAANGLTRAIPARVGRVPGDCGLRLPARATPRAGRGDAGRLAGSGGPPAHAHVPYAALRLLGPALVGRRQDRLRPALPPARGSPAGSAGRGASVAGGGGCRNTVFHARPQEPGRRRAVAGQAGRAAFSPRVARRDGKPDRPAAPVVPRSCSPK